MGDVLGRLCFGYFESKPLEQWSGDRLEEVYVGGRVEPVREVGADVVDVGFRRFDQVDDRDVWNWRPGLVDVSV